MLFIFTMCNDKDANDCFQKTGTLIRQEIILDSFEEIIVNNQLELFIKEGPEHKIIIETGENLIGDIIVNTNTNQLEITNNNSCFFYKDFNTKIIVNAPNITKIRNSSTLPVQSIGVLNYPTLQLISENYLSDYLHAGDFNLDVNTTNLSLVANGPSNHKIKGSATYLYVNLAGSNPRFEGENLIVQNAELFARSTNDILINVANEVSGNLYSTGDVLLYKEPLLMNLTAHYTGKVVVKY